MAGKPIQFDPDLVDVSTEPGYDAMAGSLGPVIRPKSIVRWAPDGSPSMAKRAEMLAIDREMSAAWDATMQKLLLQGLTDAQFTTERMFRLRLWTKERKRRQHNLHYKYDPTRRNPRLVRRDSKKQIEAMRRQLEEGQARLYARYPHLAPDDWTPPAVTEPMPEPQPVARTTQAPRTVPRRTRPVEHDASFIPAPTKLEQFIPDYLDAGIIAMIATDTGIADPARAEDTDIIAAYEASNQGGYVAEFHLALLRGRPLPERPEELG